MATVTQQNSVHTKGNSRSHLKTEQVSSEKKVSSSSVSKIEMGRKLKDTMYRHANYGYREMM